MSKELELSIRRIEEKIDNKIDQLAIMARESITPSLTPLLNDIHKDIDAIKTEFRAHTEIHEADVKAINKKLDPIIESINRKVWLFQWILKIGGAILLFIGIVKGYHEIK